MPLKWHYPLGLLYDLYSGAEAFSPDSTPSSPTSLSKHDTRQPLPWRLTLHTSAYPTTQLIPLDNANLAIHDLYIHSVKEADYLRTGTGKTVMFLSQADSTQLWDAVVKHDFSLFNPINQKLLNPQGVNLRHLPVRLYLPHAGVEEEDKGMGSVRVVQSLVRVEVGSSE